MTDGIAVSEIQSIAGLVLAVAILLVLVLRTKIHAVLALVIAAAIAGLVGGMAPDDLVASITRGFGSTLSTIGLVIGFGVMMGRILEVSGAAERMAYDLVRWLGSKREEWALALTGYVVSVPIFCDSAFIILVPLARALARTTGKSVITLGICLAGGLVLTHHAIPPTPGPLAIAGIFDVDIGLMIVWGLIFTLPAIAVVVWYGRTMGPRIEAMMRHDAVSVSGAVSGGAHAAGPGGAYASAAGTVYQENAGADDRDEVSTAYKAFEREVEIREKGLPSLALSVAPILVPIILIFMNTAATAYARFADDPELSGSLFIQISTFIGNPVMAVGIGVALAAYTLVPGRPRERVLADMEKGVESAGIILLVTGAGGALGAVLRDSGAGQVIGESVATMALPAVLIPFVIATLMRLIQGSGTVAMITGASISAPILMVIPDVNMVFAAQAAAIGSMAFSYFNDSYFWVVNRMLEVKNAGHQMLTWSVPTTLCWFSSLILLLIANFFVG